MSSVLTGRPPPRTATAPSVAHSISRILALLLSAVFLAACARDVQVPLYAVNDGEVWILTPAVSTDDGERMMALLRDVLPKAGHVPYVEWEQALETALDRQGVVAIPDVKQVPHDFRPALTRFLARGGKALFIGRAPFDHPSVVSEDGARRSQADHHEALMASGSDVPDFSAIQLWSHESSDPARRSTVRVAREPRLARPGVDVEVEHLDQWNYMRLPEVPDSWADAAYNTLTLYVRGSPHTTRLVVRAEAGDGSVWVCDVPVDSRWKAVVISEADWTYVEGGHARGQPGDRFRLAELAGLYVGLDARYAVVRPGSHEYGVSDIRPVWDHAEPPPMSESPVPLIADAKARFSFDAYAVEGARSEALYHIRRRTVDAMWPDPAIRYPDEAARWVPLFKARDRQGEAQGDVAGVFVRLALDGTPRMWGWIGVDAERSTRQALRTMINECVFHLQQGRFLVGAHAEQAVFEPPHFFMVHTRVASASSHPVAARVTAELVDREGNIVRRIVSPPRNVEAGAALESPLVLNVGVVPRAEERAVDYELRVGLEEVGGRSAVFDRTVHPVKVLGEREVPFHAELLGVSGARIAMGRVPVFFLGVDYGPGLHRRTDSNWLLPSFFPAALVRRDLERLRNAGVNAISLPFTTADQAPQLRYVMEEAQARGIWVQIRMPTLLRRLDDDAWLEGMVKALRLPGDIKVFSLDIAPESAFHETGAVPMLTDAWNDWLIEQYGDAERAWEVLHPWFDVDGTVPYPVRSQWSTWPDDAAAWSVFRRFAADFQGRRMGRAVRALRRLGCGQLVTARVSVSDADMRAVSSDPLLPFDFGTGRVHLDFATVGAGHIRGHEAELGDSAFIAAYARGLMEGRPVVWADMGVAVGRAPRAEDYENQARATEDFFELVFGTHAAGALLRHYAPISDNTLDGDEGLVHPDRSARPVMRVLRSAANRLRAYRVAPMQWAGRELEVDRGARGVRANWEDWRRVYREELAAKRVEEIRAMGYGRSSLETPAIRLNGGIAGPLLGMNGEWGRVLVGGQPVTRVPGEPIRMRQDQVLRVELINSGETLWASSRDRVNGTVWIEVRHAERRAQYLEVGETAPLRRYVVEWRPRDAGACILQPYWLGSGGFGEALQVEVMPVHSADSN